MIQIIEKVSEDLRIYICMYVLSCGGRNGGALLFLFHLKWCPILHGTCITKDIFSGDYPRKKFCFHYLITYSLFPDQVQLEYP